MIPDFPTQLRCYAAARQAAAACGHWIYERLSDARAARGRATLAVSGGSTPRLMFEHWASAHLDWSAIDIFWVDERAVPPNHEQSNYRLAYHWWLAPCNIAAGQVHRILGELEPVEGARLYRDTLAAHVPEWIEKNGGDWGVPVLDVIHLGLGADGHTASLFPGLAEIGDRTGVAAAVWVEKLGQHRITLLPGVLEAARQVAMLAAGPDKAKPLGRVLAAEGDPFETPGRLAPRDRTVYFIDEAATPEL
jgi:6-phosphogluconolactonase